MATQKDEPDQIRGPTASSGQHQGKLPKVEVDLNGVAKTLLVTLVARAQDFSAPQSILGDAHAQHVLERLDIDVAEMSITPYQLSSVALRASKFDRWTGDFLQKHPNTTVLHMACGFDSRMDRVNWGQNTRWIDIDLPEVIEIRRKIMPESLPGRDYSLLGIDVLDENWMQAISTHGPVLVVMEGLLCYFREEDVNRLLQRLCRYFRAGELLFEVINSRTLDYLNRSKPIQSISNTGAEFHSAVDDPNLLENLHPGLNLVESIRLAEAPGVEKFALGHQLLMYLLSWIPGARDSARFLRFQFGGIGGVAESEL